MLRWGAIAWSLAILLLDETAVNEEMKPPVAEEFYRMGLIHNKESESHNFTAIHNGKVLGYIAIDSTIRGRSSGGLRMHPDIGESEIQSLARTMTLKYGFLGLPQGGAKAGVFGDPEAPQMERRERLVEFGQSVADILHTRTFIPHADMGTDNGDIRFMLNSLGIRVPRRDLQGNSSGYYTALSVSAGVKKSATHLGIDLLQCTVAIEGFGNVGRPLASLLSLAGVKVVAISTSQGGLYNPQGLEVDELIRLSDETGSGVVKVYRKARFITREALLELPVDILCPCARWNSLDMSNAARIATRVICPGANNPVTPDAERALSERGVLCLPDFVTNSGGVLGGTMEFASVSRESIVSFIDRYIGGCIGWLLDESRVKKLLPREIVVPLALQRFEQAARCAANPTLLGRLFEAALECYRRGWIPSSLVAILSLPYFHRKMAAWPEG